MSDSEELPRKTSKGFSSGSLSLPDDAEEDEAEEEAFLLATALLRSGCWQLSGASPPPGFAFGADPPDNWPVTVSSGTRAGDDST